MKRLKSRLEALEINEQSITCENARVLELWQGDWENGTFSYIEGHSWKPGESVENLAELAWLHHRATDKTFLSDLSFYQFWEVKVRGIDPKWL